MKVIIAEQSMIYREYLMSKFIKRGYEVTLVGMGIAPTGDFDFYVTDYCVESQKVINSINSPDKCIVIFNEITKNSAIDVKAIRFMKSFDGQKVDQLIDSLEG